MRRRAGLLASVRAFMTARGVLEVETPVLSAATVTDPHLASLSCLYRGPGADSAVSPPGGGRRLFLQTSPEYPMKRLLAAGCGPIFQVARCFRDGEAGRLHNPEFTLLEWYRPGWDHYRLMDEIDELLGELLSTPPGERLTYRDLFARHAEVDPLTAPVEELDAVLRRAGVDDPGLDEGDRDGRLHLLLTHAVEPRLPPGRVTLVHDFPASQAALARIRPGTRSTDGEDEPAVAERFEVYIGPVELANGFYELGDAAEQRDRFVADLRTRERLGLPAVPLDERLLAALETGLPDCAGVALGIDRLVLLALGAETLADVIAFPIDRA